METKQKKPKLGRIYFTEETEKAIVKYNESTDPDERELIFTRYIHAPLDKMAENIINRFKFPYMDGSFEDVKAQVVAYLVMNLHKYTADKGKAFSYFSIVAKNYLILNNNNFYKEEKRVVYLTDKEDDTHSVEELLVVDTQQNEIRSDLRDFLELSIQYWNFNIPRIFKKKRDIEIAYAIVRLMERIDRIENFNKKALYLMIREMTDYKTSHITKVINKMKTVIFKQLNEFRQTGHVSDPSNYFVYKNK
jgi:hypothetical protein